MVRGVFNLKKFLLQRLGEKIVTASGDMNGVQMRAACKKEMAAVAETGVVNQRVQIYKSNVLKSVTRMAHKQNYILLAAHNFTGYSADE